MVNDEDREFVIALELPQVGEDSGDLQGGVLVQAMKADEWIEDEESWSVASDGSLESTAIILPVKPKGGLEDDMDYGAHQE